MSTFAEQCSLARLSISFPSRMEGRCWCSPLHREQLDLQDFPESDEGLVAKVRTLLRRRTYEPMLGPSVAGDAGSEDS